MNTVLCVTDDDLTRMKVQDALGLFGINSVFIQSAEFGSDSFSNAAISAVLLDASLGKEQVGDLARQIKDRATFPILVIIMPGQEQDLPDMLEVGVDDFVISPIRSEELGLRLQVLLLRSPLKLGKFSRDMLTCEGLRLDIKEHRVWKDDRPIVVSPMGFSLLTYFLTHLGKVVTKRQLMQEVWGYTNSSENTNLVEIGIARLRRELGEDPKHPAYLHTVWGQGYRFEYRGQTE